MTQALWWLLRAVPLRVVVMVVVMMMMLLLRVPAVTCCPLEAGVAANAVVVGSTLAGIAVVAAGTVAAAVVAVRYGVATRTKALLRAVACRVVVRGHARNRSGWIHGDGGVHEGERRGGDTVNAQHPQRCRPGLARLEQRGRHAA